MATAHTEMLTNGDSSSRTRASSSDKPLESRERCRRSPPGAVHAGAANPCWCGFVFPATKSAHRPSLQRRGQLGEGSYPAVPPAGPPGRLFPSVITRADRNHDRRHACDWSDRQDHFVRGLNGVFGSRGGGGCLLCVRRGSKVM